jgi:hypothetical protein
MLPHAEKCKKIYVLNLNASYKENFRLRNVNKKFINKNQQKIST